MRKTKWLKSLGVFGLAACMLCQSSLVVLAAEVRSDSSLAGISAVMSNYFDNSEEEEAEDNLRKYVLSSGNSCTVSLFNNFAISKVEDYVNIREEPSTDSEIVGKIYDQCGANILDYTYVDDSTWYYIESGTVKGYILSDFFVTGEEAKQYALSNGSLYMKISEDGINVRSAADPESDVITVLYEGDSCSVIDEVDNYVEVILDDGETGYICKDYVEIYVDCDTAISLEEEQEMLEEIARMEEEARQQAEAEAKAQAEAAEAQARAEAAQAAAEQAAAEARAAAAAAQAQADAEAQAAAQRAAAEAQAAAEAAARQAAEAQAAAEQQQQEQQQQEESNQNNQEQEEENQGSSGNSSSSSASRDAVVNYAWSKVGCAYVWGASGPSSFDCSGLVMAAYAQAGVSLSHYSGSQAGAGTAVSLSEAQAGDILWMPGHVGIYVGDGTVIEAANENYGVRVSSLYSGGWYYAVNVLG